MYYYIFNIYPPCSDMGKEFTKNKPCIIREINIKTIKKWPPILPMTVTKIVQLLKDYKSNDTYLSYSYREILKTLLIGLLPYLIYMLMSLNNLI